MVPIQKFFCFGLRTTSQIVAWADVILCIFGVILFSWAAANPDFFVKTLIESLFKDSQQETKEFFVEISSSK